MTNFLSRITSTYQMTNHPLTQEQYDILMLKEAEFVNVVEHRYSRNLDHQWLLQMKEIYQSIYSGDISITCTSCVIAGMSRLWKSMKAYKATLQPHTAPTVTPNTSNEQSTPKTEQPKASNKNTINSKRNPANKGRK